LSEHRVDYILDGNLPGYLRFHTYDSFGKQLEFLQADPTP
jgi:hypothetical protein